MGISLKEKLPEVLTSRLKSGKLGEITAQWRIAISSGQNSIQTVA